MNSIVQIFLLAAVVRAQWNIPGGSNGLEPALGSSLGQAQGPFGGYYGGTGLPTSQGANSLVTGLGPQFAQFGSQYGINNIPNYGSQSIPMEPTSFLAGSRSSFDVNPLLLPSQTRPVRQFTHQPGGFGLQAPPQSPYGQFGLGASQPGAAPQPFPYSPFQADDYAGSVQKQASVPPSEPIRVIPPFLKGQNKEDQDKFYSIVQHPTWSPAEKNTKIEELISSMNADVQNIYAQYQRASSGDLTAKRQKVHEAVAAMSPEAQQQFQKVSALMTNPRIPEQERLQKIQDLYSQIPDSIKREFDSKFINL